MDLPRIAFVHDRLVTRGGAETVMDDMIRGTLNTLAQTIDNSPKSKETTSLPPLTLDSTPLGCDPQSHATCRLFCLFSSHKTTTIDGYTINICAVLTGKHISRRYRYLLPLYPFFTWLLKQRIKRFAPTATYASHFACIKHALPAQSLNHLYIHSPMQYIREMADEYRGRFGKRIRWCYTLLMMRLRRRDRLTDRSRITSITANSDYTAECIECIYNQHVDAIMPPHHTLPTHTHEINSLIPPYPYIIYIGRLVRFAKYVDTIIAAAIQSRTHLILLGDGPDEKYLRAYTAQHDGTAYIHFWGRVSDPQIKHTLLRHASALINLTKESYGIVIAEAIATHTPIIGRHEGGTPSLTATYTQKNLLTDRSLTSIIDAIMDATTQHTAHHKKTKTQ